MVDRGDIGVRYLRRVVFPLGKTICRRHGESRPLPDDMVRKSIQMQLPGLRKCIAGEVQGT